MMRSLPIAAAALLLLAGCQEKATLAEDASSPNPNGATGAPVVASPTAVPPAGPPGVEGSTQPSPAGTMETAESGPLPARYVGRWGLTANDCDPKRDDAKGLMTVAPDRLTFYESRAVVRDLDLQAGTAVLDLAFTGEGQEWTVKSAWTLEDNGQVLVRRDTGWENGVFRYRKCPA